MKNGNLEILESLETLAAAFPWEAVELDLHREPRGKITYCAVMRGDSNLALDFACEFGDSPTKAVAQAVKRFKNRNPEAKRTAKIAELRQQITKLEAVVIGLPPYVPNRELARVNLPEVPETIDV